MRLLSERYVPPIMGIYSYIACVEGDLKKNVRFGDHPGLRQAQRKSERPK